MLDAIPATAIIIGFLLIWGILIPVCGVIPKIKSIISYRYLIIIVFLACMVGVIINFSGLESSIRIAVVISSAILAGLYILIRSFEKAAYNGWIGHRDIKASLQKGDISASVELTDKNKGDSNEYVSGYSGY